MNYTAETQKPLNITWFYSKSTPCPFVDICFFDNWGEADALSIWFGSGKVSKYIDIQGRDSGTVEATIYGNTLTIGNPLPRNMEILLESHGTPELRARMSHGLLPIKFNKT